MSLAPQQTAPIKFSSDELRVLQQCNRDSFYQRCLPLSSIFGFGTWWAIKAGHLQPSIRFGAAPKVAVAVVIGYIFGKVSYQRVCAEKLMALPDSKVGQLLRNRKAGIMDSPFSMGIPTDAPVMQSAPTSDPKNHPNSSMDLDFDRPNISGLDDTYRPRMDDFTIPTPSHTDGIPPSSSYDDLRRKNREEYEMKRTKPYRGVITPEEVPSALRQHDEDYSRGRRADPEPDLWSQPAPRKPTNLYGDVFER